MKPANQLMATMGNLPAVDPRQPLQVTPQTAEVVNDLFRRLRGIFPAWRQAWPSTEALGAAKAEWLTEFADAGSPHAGADRVRYPEVPQAQEAVCTERR